MKLQINIKLALLLFTTKKQFLLYNLNEDKTKIVNYKLSNDYELTGHNRNFQGFKVVSCINKELTNINF
jgi:hypothetical protein